MERPSTSAMQMLYAELAAVKAQNARLEEENLLLRHRLNRASKNQHTNATMNVEAKVQAFQMEEERDRILETLQEHKKKYNKLHDAYLEKVKRCKALEDMFKRQKTLTGLVMKSAIEQRNSEQRMLLEKRQSQQSRNSVNEVEQLQAKMAKMQKALDESYDIIDEMDFELESVDLLEMQNQSLRDELATLKAQLATLKAQLATAQAAALPEPPADDDDPPPKYVEDEASISEADGASLEREAMTKSLIQTVEAESNCLRRELLRSRWQHTAQGIAKKEKEAEED